MTTRIIVSLFLFIHISSFICAQEEDEELKFMRANNRRILLSEDFDGPIEITKSAKEKDIYFIKRLLNPLDFYARISNMSDAVPLYWVFMDGKKEGLWVKPGGFEGNLREETYHNGVLHGISRVFSFDHTLLYQTFFKNGTGYYVDYHYENGQVFVKGDLVNGKREGVWKTYFRSGHLHYQENYKDGLLQGKKTTYFESGNVQVVENYKDNLLHGEYLVFDKEGNVLYTTQFTNGTGLYKSYDLKSKRIVEEGRFENGYRIGTWIKYSQNIYQPDEPSSGYYREYTKDSPENIHLTHNLIETVYDNGKIYHIYARNPDEDSEL